MAYLICGCGEERVDRMLAAYALLKSSVSNVQCLAICCEQLGYLHRHHQQEASGYLLEAISAYDSIGDRTGRAFSLHRWAKIIYEEDPSLAYQLMADARRLFMAGESFNAGETFCTANSLASWAQQSGNHHLAMRFLCEGLTNHSPASLRENEWVGAHSKLFTLELKNLSIPQACAHFILIHRHNKSRPGTSFTIDHFSALSEAIEKSNGQDKEPFKALCQSLAEWLDQYDVDELFSPKPERNTVPSQSLTALSDALSVANTLVRMQGYCTSVSSFAQRVIPKILERNSLSSDLYRGNSPNALFAGLELLHYCGSQEELGTLLRYTLSGLLDPLSRPYLPRFPDKFSGLCLKALSLGLDTSLEQICREDSLSYSTTGQSRVRQFLAELALYRGQYQEALKLYQTYVEPQEFGDDPEPPSTLLRWLALKADDRTSADRYHHEVLATLAKPPDREYWLVETIRYGIQVKDYGSVFDSLRSIPDEGELSNFKRLVVRIREEGAPRGYVLSVELLTQLPHCPMRERVIKSLLSRVTMDGGVVERTRALHYLGTVTFNERRFVAAIQYFTEALGHWSRFKWISRQAESLESLAEVAVAQSREDVAIGFYVVALCKWSRSGNFETAKNQTVIFEKLAELGAIEIEPSTDKRHEPSQIDDRWDRWRLGRPTEPVAHPVHPNFEPLASLVDPIFDYASSSLQFSNRLIGNQLEKPHVDRLTQDVFRRCTFRVHPYANLRGHLRLKTFGNHREGFHIAAM